MQVPDEQRRDEAESRNKMLSFYDGEEKEELDAREVKIEGSTLRA